MILSIILALRLVLAAPLSAAPPGFFPPEPAATDDSYDDADQGGEDSESESDNATAVDPIFGPGLRYTGDLSDAELARRWHDDLDSLGSVSIGFAEPGRLINAAQLPDDPAWIRQRPDLAWGAQETVESLATAFRAVHTQFPDSVPARLSHIGAKDGGYLRPHKSHQSGRDADIAFFYKKDVVPGGRGRRDRFIDPVRSWALVRALITQTDVQVILMDRGIQDVLRNYALEAGEDRAWLGRIFRNGKASLVQHARKHRDHFHARFFAPRSQELGRRLAPLLAERADQNVVVHRVKRGQTLGAIAHVYATSVSAILKANHLHKTFLSLDQRLQIPLLHKPCNRWPIPPAVVVPARCLPPSESATAAL